MFALNASNSSPKLFQLLMYCAGNASVGFLTIVRLVCDVEVWGVMFVGGVFDVPFVFKGKVLVRDSGGLSSAVEKTHEVLVSFMPNVERIVGHRITEPPKTRGGGDDTYASHGGDGLHVVVFEISGSVPFRANGTSDAHSMFVDYMRERAGRVVGLLKSSMGGLVDTVYNIGVISRLS